MEPTVKLEDVSLKGKACSTQEMEAAIQELTTKLTLELRKIHAQLEIVSGTDATSPKSRQTQETHGQTSCNGTSDIPHADMQKVAIPQTRTELINEADAHINIHFTLDPKQSKAKDTIILANDHDVDASSLVLRHSESLGNIFTVDVDIATKAHHVDEYYKEGLLKQCITTDTFSNIVTLAIVANVIYLAVESDLNDEHNIYDSAWYYLLADQFFCVFFTGELALRFFAFANKRDAIRDGWFNVDLFLVLTMVLELWILVPCIRGFSSKGSNSKFKVPTQPLRVIRLLKLARMARLMKALPELISMIHGLLQALRAIFSTILLLALMVYAWSILILMFMKEEKEFNAYLETKYHYHFDNILDCAWTLLMCGTLLLDNTGLIMTDLMNSNRFAHKCVAISFLSYSFLSSLLILQMLIGVLCDVVCQGVQDRKDAESICLMKQELLDDLIELDDGHGRISRENLLIILESDAARILFKKLGVNRHFLTNIASLTFRNADTPVPIRDILELILTCQGDNTATVKIVASALCFLSDEIAHLHDNMHVNFKCLNGAGSSYRSKTTYEAI